MDNETEVWKSHPDIDIIEVSSFGRVRTLDRLGSRKNGTYSKKGRVLKPWDNGNGYLLVHIPINGKQVAKYVHRLVAETFIPNPDILPEINHKDGNRAHNRVDNLEFCTHSYNIQYREKYGKTLGKPIYAINLATLKVSQFQSQHEASRILGLSQGNINSVIKGRYKQTGGYRFENADVE